MAQRIKMAFTLRKMGIDSIEGTPLQDYISLVEDEVLTRELFSFIKPIAQLLLAGRRN